MKSNILNFERPENLQATEPAENRGIKRDEVKLLISTPDGSIHTQFKDLPNFLQAGDLIVVNDSATIPASLPAESSLGTIIVNLSTDYGNGVWLVEPRWSTSRPGPLPLKEGERLTVGGVTTKLLSQYPGLPRLWFAQLDGDVQQAIADYGTPIRYGYVDDGYELDAYQSVFSQVPGSAEMPSAARPFTKRVVDALKARGVNIATIRLHTGVSSLEVESEELEETVMYPEPFKVPHQTADAVNKARSEGRRVIAVGTTVVRALESAWDGEQVKPVSGFTRLFIHPNRGVNVVDGLLTGFHDPMASHLAMLYAIAGEDMVRLAYQEAVASGYLWHEFGDSNLILSRRAKAA